MHSTISASNLYTNFNCVKNKWLDRNANRDTAFALLKISGYSEHLYLKARLFLSSPDYFRLTEKTIIFLKPLFYSIFKMSCILMKNWGKKENTIQKIATFSAFVDANVIWNAICT